MTQILDPLAKWVIFCQTHNLFSSPLINDGPQKDNYNCVTQSPLTRVVSIGVHSIWPDQEHRCYGFQLRRSISLVKSMGVLEPPRMVLKRWRARVLGVKWSKCFFWKNTTISVSPLMDIVLWSLDLFSVYIKISISFAILLFAGL